MWKTTSTQPCPPPSLDLGSWAHRLPTDYPDTLFMQDGDLRTALYITKTYRSHYPDTICHTSKRLSAQKILLHAQGRMIVLNFDNAFCGMEDITANEVAKCNSKECLTLDKMMEATAVIQSVPERMSHLGTCRGRSAVVKACDMQCRRPPQGLPRNCTRIFSSSGVA